jgi:acetate kinase
MRDRYSQLTGPPVEETSIVTLHLESGRSACAIRDGKSIDTSMGFTPLEGLVMYATQQAGVFCSAGLRCEQCYPP